MTPCPVCDRPRWGAGCRYLDCAAGRAHLDRETRVAARRREVRSPPPCPHDGEPGVCRLCGQRVVKPRRSWCGSGCVAIYEITRFPSIALRHLTAFYPGCWSCGRLEWGPGGYTGLTLAVDHVRPLWSLTDAERLELRWWLPFNLQLLCDECHRIKTRREAGERAARRRAGVTTGAIGAAVEQPSLL